MRSLSTLLFCLSLIGCSSPSRLKSKPDIVNSRLDPKIQEYTALRNDELSLHNASKFVKGDPRIFAKRVLDFYPKEFVQVNCAKDVSSGSCAQRFKQDVFSKLSTRYFAADLLSVARTCLSEPLICDDLNTLETLFRHLHNSSIDQSEHEKLDLIEDWRRGEMTDEQLKASLHLDFKFQNGKLEIGLPSG